MTSQPSPIPEPADAAGLPLLLFVSGDQRTTMALERMPFTIGRKPDKDLVIPDARVSRDHAIIECVNGDFYLVDQGSKHGTYVNGQRVTRHKLAPDDCLEFGVRQEIHAIFQPSNLATQSSAAREFLSQIAVMAVPGTSNELEKLTLFLEAARKLNTTGAVDEVLVTLIETTLRLTHAERGYVFLRAEDGSLHLAAARSSAGKQLMEDRTISHSILKEAADGASEFLVTDTLRSSNMAGRQSIVANELRTVIAIPLRKTSLQGELDKEGKSRPAMGVLYLDSRMVSADIGNVSHEILSAIAHEAAALVENAHLARVEEISRRNQQELNIAAGIQQRLMSVTIPEIPYARLQARNLPCRDIGGDFYDVVCTEGGVAVVVTDVSGKGISAALLASILQGMVYSQLLAGVPLREIAATCNRFLCQKVRGEKYATMILAQLSGEGVLQFVNCGHVLPVLISGGQVTRVEGGNVPVGLLEIAEYSDAEVRLRPGDRLVLVTDGVTEAENAGGEFYGEERLEEAAPRGFDGILKSVRGFCGETPLSDDCTILELSYQG